MHLEDTAGRTRDTVTDRLHSWNISKIVPGHGRLGHATLLRPLYGPGLPEGVSGKGAYGLLIQSAPLPPPTPSS